MIRLDKQDSPCGIVAKDTLQVELQRFIPQGEQDKRIHSSMASWQLNPRLRNRRKFLIRSQRNNEWLLIDFVIIAKVHRFDFSVEENLDSTEMELKTALIGQNPVRAGMFIAGCDYIGTPKSPSGGIS